MKIVLSERLNRVANFIPEKTRLLDIGSDHAYLPIALIENKQIEYAIAGEVVFGPYKSAVDNVKSAGLTDVITVRLASGLEAMEQSDAIKTISICGMGGRLISDILEQGKTKLQNVTRLVLQPNNRENEVRKWLENNNFQIISEAILEENDKIYEIIVAEKGKMTLSNCQFIFGPHLLENRDSIFKKKWEREQAKIGYALSQIPENHPLERQKLEERYNVIKKVVNES